jgi:hypothetical protein
LGTFQPPAAPGSLKSEKMKRALRSAVRHVLAALWAVNLIQDFYELRPHRNSQDIQKFNELNLKINDPRAGGAQDLIY